MIPPPAPKSRQLSRREFGQRLVAGVGGALVAPGVAAAVAAGRRRPNVLLIAVDDLRPMLGCYGAPIVKSPNFDRLAARGVVFEHAYCQMSVCSPSRTSMLTGARPDTTRIFDNGTHFRVHRPDAVTLPQHFRLNGYHSASLGKVFHSQWDHAYVGRTMDDPVSWSEPAWYPPTVQFYFTKEGEDVARRVFAATPGCKLHEGGFCLHTRKRAAGKTAEKKGATSEAEWKQHFIMGLVAESPDVPESALYDGQLAERAVTTLRRLKERSEPFFLSVGFTRPHVPYVAPKRYWDLYDRATLKTAPNPNPPVGAPPWTLLENQDWDRYADFPADARIDDALARRLIHGYLACVSYADAQIGRVLAELDRLGLADDTIVVLTADHGYHLGDNSRWGKQTCLEAANRVPLIISAPGRGLRGEKSPRLAESVDIYPTLCELAGLPLPTSLEGTSLVPLLEDPRRPWKQAAFSQFPRPDRSSAPGVAAGPEDKMGYAMRTERYRYVEWRFVTRPDQIAARELYDYRTDPGESRNVANETAQQELVAQLHRQLAAGWRGSLPPRS